MQQAQAAWACLLDATAGAAFEERVLSAVTVRDAWCQILSWTGLPVRPKHYFSRGSSKLFLTTGMRTPNFSFLEWTSYLPACDRPISTKPRGRSLTSSPAIFPIATRSRSAPGLTLFFSGAKTWSIERNKQVSNKYIFTARLLGC